MGIFATAPQREKKLPLTQRYNPNANLKRHYVGNKVYETVGSTLTLKKILFDNGYIENNIYYFYLRDHLGNNSVVVDANGVLKQRLYYYPYGKVIGNQESYAEGFQPYKFGGKEAEPMFGLGLYDFEARQLDGYGGFTSMDPHAESYYSWSPYAYCANNPIRYKDPDGRDGMVTGSGTREDPYVITANYYYQNGSLNDEQITGLNSAVSAYNNSGKNGLTEVKNADGSKSYVRYNLSAEGVNNVDDARLTTAFETTSGDTRYYGNIVGTEPSSGDEYGSANNIRIDFNVDNISAGVESGMKSSPLNKGVAIHEIGHNLGGEHSDGTSVMDIVLKTETHNQFGGATTVSYSYPSMDKKFTKTLIDRRDVPRTAGAGRLWTRRP
ncbi:RHS repeat-associated core domain-containing protein [Viscerimonas tarda]